MRPCGNFRFRVSSTIGTQLQISSVSKMNGCVLQRPTYFTCCRVRSLASVLSGEQGLGNTWCLLLSVHFPVNQSLCARIVNKHYPPHLSDLSSPLGAGSGCKVLAIKVVWSLVFVVVWRIATRRCLLKSSTKIISVRVVVGGKLTAFGPNHQHAAGKFVCYLAL